MVGGGEGGVNQGGGVIKRRVTEKGEGHEGSYLAYIN